MIGFRFAAKRSITCHAQRAPSEFCIAAGYRNRAVNISMPGGIEDCGAR
jgi:hypothetical protein